MTTHSKPIPKTTQSYHARKGFGIRMLFQPTLTICLILLSSFLFYFKSFSAGIPSDSSSIDTVLLSEVEIINDIYLFKGIPFSGVGISHYDWSVRAIPHRIISLKDGRKNGLSITVVDTCYRNWFCLERRNYINDSLDWIEVNFLLLEVKNANHDFDYFHIWEKPIDVPDSISFYYENKPYTGKGIFYFDRNNKQVQTTAEFKNGKLYGVMEGRNILGNLKFKVEYKDGLKNGKELHFGREGVVLSNSNYKNGKLDSLYESFYQDGKLNTTGIYLNGKKEGVWKSFYPNGKTNWIHEYKNGKNNGIFQYWDKNGIMQSEAYYENGLQCDSSVIWYSNGIKKEVTYYDKGNKTGKYFTWYENGQLKEESQYQIIEWKKTGKYFSWYQNGQLKEESQYQKDNLFNFIHWNESGQKKGEYKCNDSDAFCSYVSYFMNGLKQTEGRMKITHYRNTDDNYESIKDGLWTYFDPIGDTDKVENWKFGMLYSTAHYDWEGKNILFIEETPNQCLIKNKKINEIFKEKGRIFSDQSILDPEFLKFKNKLMKSMKQKNKTTFLQLLADTVEITFGYDQYGGPKKDIREIENIMQYSAFPILRFGFKKISADEFTTFPLIDDVAKDDVANADLWSCCEIMVVDSEVSVMETPSEKGNIAGKINMGCSPTLDVLPYPFVLPSTHENSDENTYWYQVFFSNGLAGFVNSKHCITSYDFSTRVIVKKTKTGWKITSIYAGPGC